MSALQAFKTPELNIIKKQMRVVLFLRVIFKYSYFVSINRELKISRRSSDL